MLEVVGRDLVDAAAVALVRRVQHEQVEPAERLLGVRDEVLAVLLAAQVARQQQRIGAGVGDPLRGLLGIGLLARQVGDRDVRALAGERDRDGPADARSRRP